MFQLVSNLDPIQDLVDQVHPRVLLLHLLGLVSVHDVPHLGRVCLTQAAFNFDWSRIDKSYQNVDTRAFSGRQTTSTASPLKVRIMLKPFGIQITAAHRQEQRLPTSSRWSRLKGRLAEVLWREGSSGKPGRGAFNLTTWRWWTELPLSLSHSRLQSNSPPGKKN